MGEGGPRRGGEERGAGKRARPGPGRRGGAQTRAARRPPPKCALADSIYLCIELIIDFHNFFKITFLCGKFELFLSKKVKKNDLK